MLASLLRSPETAREGPLQRWAQHRAIERLAKVRGGRSTIANKRQERLTRWDQLSSADLPQRHYAGIDAQAATAQSPPASCESRACAHIYAHRVTLLMALALKQSSLGGQYFFKVLRLGEQRSLVPPLIGEDALLRRIRQSITTLTVGTAEELHRRSRRTHTERRQGRPFSDETQ